MGITSSSTLRRPLQSPSHRSRPKLLKCSSALKPCAVPLCGMLARIASVDRGLPRRSLSRCTAWAEVFFRAFRDASAALGCTFPFHVMDIAATSKTRCRLLGRRCRSEVVRNSCVLPSCRLRGGILRFQPQLSATYWDVITGIAADDRIASDGLDLPNVPCSHCCEHCHPVHETPSPEPDVRALKLSVPLDQFAHFCLN